VTTSLEIDIAYQYIHVFNNHDVDTLSKMYAADVSLSEWGENVYTGIADVLAENKRLFLASPELYIDLQSVSQDPFNKRVFLQILVYLTPKSEPVRIVDSICVNDSGQIEDIFAYRGF